MCHPRLVVRLAFSALWMISGSLSPQAAESPQKPSHHIGRDLPDYVTGDECLFCHRNVVGSSWHLNAHQRTLQPRVMTPDIDRAIESTPELDPYAKQIQFVLGYQTQIRLLRKAPSYGQLELLTGSFEPDPDSESTPFKFHASQPLDWEPETFSQRCAGCHATAVDSRTQAFAATAIDCYACHGSVDLAHTNDPSLVYLAKKRNDSPALIAATCGQCHVRTGTSTASGLPYANNYVVGDDLFADFAVDWSPAALDTAPPRERHILENIRAIREDNEETTCLSCHNIHRASGRRHRTVASSTYCHICHQPEAMTLTYDRRVKHHPLCGY